MQNKQNIKRICSIIILEHNGSGTIGLKPIMEPLVLTINSNYQYNLDRKEISNILAKYFLHGHFYSHITKINYTKESIIIASFFFGKK